MDVSLGGIGERQAMKENAEIRNLLDRYRERWTAHDGDGWMALWDEEGVQMPPNDVMHVGKEAIRRSNTPTIDERSTSWDFVIDPQEVILVGRGYATARGVYQLKGTPSDGRPALEMDGKFLSIFKKQTDGSWRFFRDCFNSNLPLW